MDSWKTDKLPSFYNNNVIELHGSFIKRCENNNQEVLPQDSWCNKGIQLKYVVAVSGHSPPRIYETSLRSNIGAKCGCLQQEACFKIKRFCWFSLLGLYGRTPWPAMPSLTTGTFTFLLERDLCQEPEFKVHFPVIPFNRSVDLIRRRSTGPEVIFPDFQTEGKNGTQPNKLWDSICLFVCTHAWTFNFWLSSSPSGFALHPADRISCQWEQEKKKKPGPIIPQHKRRQ